MKTLRVCLAVCAGIAASAPATASAEPPRAPHGCAVVPGTPAASAGSATGLANRIEVYVRLCLG